MQEVIRASREQEENRRREEQRRRDAEEEAVARAIEASRAQQEHGPADKGKGKARMPFDQGTDGHGVARDPCEDEALEFAVRLSLDEAARQYRWQRQQQQYSTSVLAPHPPAHAEFGVAETSAQAFARYSQPVASSSVMPGPAATSSSTLAPPRRGMSLLDDDLGVPLDDIVEDVASLPPPPPAYELPAHAPELDQPGDVIVGPGRPLPAAPFPTSGGRPLPTPPVVLAATDRRKEAPPTRDEPFRPAVATDVQPFTLQCQLDSILTPTDSEVDPFGDEHAVQEHSWEPSHWRTGSPGSGTSAVSESGGLELSADTGEAPRPDATVAPIFEEARGEIVSTEVRELPRRPLRVLAAAPPPLPKPAPVSPPRATEPCTPSGEVPPIADSALTSPISVVRGSVPSFGGYVEEGSSISASERILREVKWDFVHLDLSKSGRRPPLAYEGDFPRGAQLSLVQDPDGRQAFVSFAFEARTWQGLLVYLMWHGNSRFEAAPFDLERDKSGRGYRASVSIDFYRAPSTSSSAVSIRPPRVRARVTLLPLLERPPQHPETSTSPLGITVVSTPSFDPVNPNIRLDLTVPPTLPIALSSLASLLADAHAAAREVTSPALRTPARTGKAVTSPLPSAGQQALVSAVELFRKLGGEEIRPAHGHQDAHDDERSLLDRMKARLRRRRGPQLVPVLNDDPSEGLALPEGACCLWPRGHADENEAVSPLTLVSLHDLQAPSSSRPSPSILLELVLLSILPHMLSYYATCVHFSDPHVCTRRKK